MQEDVEEEGGKEEEEGGMRRIERGRMVRKRRRMALTPSPFSSAMARTR